MMPGLVDNEEVSLSKMFEAVGARKANMIDDAKLFEYETNTCPGLWLLCRNVYRKQHELSV